MFFKYARYLDVSQYVSDGNDHATVHAMRQSLVIEDADHDRDCIISPQFYTYSRYVGLHLTDWKTGVCFEENTPMYYLCWPWYLYLSDA